MARTVAVTCMLLLSACRDATAPAGTVGIGVIEVPGQQSPALVAPETVRVHVPFAITVHSWGANGCTQPESLNIRLTPLTAVLTPFERADTRTNCPDVIVLHSHPASLRFTAVGQATIWVRGAISFGSEIDSVHATLTVVP